MFSQHIGLAMGTLLIALGGPACWAYAFVLIFPDKILEWWSQKTGKPHGLGYLLGLEAVAIIVWSMITYNSMNPERPVDWVKPWLAAIFLGCMRMILAALRTEP